MSNENPLKEIKITESQKDIFELENIENLTKHIFIKNNTFEVLYYFDKVEVGDYQGTDKIKKMENLKEFRIFSEKGELYVWRVGESLKYRLKTDKSNEFYEMDYFLWNEDADKKRGLETNSAYKKYRVRNYLDKNEDGSVKIIDARLVKLIKKDDKNA